MHELAMAEGLLRDVLDAADGRGVEAVRVRIGRLHAVMPDSLRFSFQLLSEDTAASAATLEIIDDPIVLHCHRCGERREGDLWAAAVCDQCGESGMALVGGAGLAVEEVRLSSGLSVVPETRRLSEHIVSHLVRQHGFPIP